MVGQSDLSDSTTHHKMQQGMPEIRVKLKRNFWTLKSNGRTKHGFAGSTSGVPYLQV